jgi:hypothetical protein
MRRRITPQGLSANAPTHQASRLKCAGNPNLYGEPGRPLKWGGQGRSGGVNDPGQRVGILRAFVSYFNPMTRWSG